MESCKHEKFETQSRVGRLKESDDSEEITGYTLDVKVRCAQCDMYFEFVGVPNGYSPMKPMASADFTELRIPIRPNTDAFATDLSFQVKPDVIADKDKN